MDRLQAVVFDRLASAIGPDLLYFQKGPTRPTYPYVVFSFPNDIDPYRAKRPTVLEVDVYDAERSGYNVAREIEQLTNTIDKALDYRTALQVGMGVKWQRIGRLALPTPEDSNLWRRQLRYVAKAWFLEKE